MFRMGDTPGSIRHGGRGLGQDGGDVLEELLGMSGPQGSLLRCTVYLDPKPAAERIEISTSLMRRKLAYLGTALAKTAYSVEHQPRNRLQRNRYRLEWGQNVTPGARRHRFRIPKSPSQQSNSISSVSGLR